MCDLNKYMFLIEQDVKVLFGELVQETYTSVMGKLCVCGSNKTLI
jgi:hypothetical protein